KPTTTPLRRIIWKWLHCLSPPLSVEAGVVFWGGAAWPDSGICVVCMKAPGAKIVCRRVHIQLCFVGVVDGKLRVCYMMLKLTLFSVLTTIYCGCLFIEH